MANAIFNADNMASTDVNIYLGSGLYQESAVDTEVANGVLAVKGALNSREVYLLTAPTAITDAVVIIDAPEVVYSEELTKGLEDFVNVAGKAVRYRKPIVGDKFAISALGIDPLTDAASIAVGSVLTTQIGKLMEEKAAAGGTESFVAEIESIRTTGAGFGGRATKMYECVVTKAL